ncbi:hypothetical protein GJ744_004047 [Endocarpon pusillum]|uniref:Zn(2)-C6 fungal-type domain-containing protein n=1 Tax=Endocarpon pusillum TaxID=364733 RepID=A0A8H7A9V2_9EURO|nr:hypothetical protein GJ744_004047 [Endocarpon pusillum]
MDEWYFVIQKREGAEYTKGNMTTLAGPLTVLLSHTFVSFLSRVGMARGLDQLRLKGCTSPSVVHFTLRLSFARCGRGSTDMETRSQNGCWTCRIRKIKCDEKRPICTECLGMGLQCHSPGQKPAWMDRGARQKAQAAKIKQKVAEVVRQRRAIANPGQHRILSKHVPSDTAAATDTPNPSASSIIDEGDQCHTAVAFDQQFLSPSHMQPDAHSFDPTHKDGIVLNPCYRPVAEDTITEYAASLNTPAVISGDGFGMADVGCLNQNSFNFGIGNPVMPQTMPSIRMGDMLPAFQTNIYTSYPVETPALSISNVEDASLLAQYLIRTFDWQFPFCSASPTAFNSGHLVWLMAKSRPLFLTTLALSSSYLSVENRLAQPSSQSVHEERTRRYDVAWQEYQIALRSSQSGCDVSVLACTVQFIYAHLLHAERTGWRSHLQASSCTITTWIDSLLSKNQSTTMAPEDKSRIFFLASMIRFDILSVLTRGVAPTSSDRYKNVLAGSDPLIDLQPVAGSENWVFIVLLDVFALRDWKRARQLTGLLSLWDLTSRAQKINEHLDRGIATNLERMEKLVQKPKLDLEEGSPLLQYESNILVVTHIFACAVSVLLEVVVSGARLQLPDVRRKVDRAIESFALIDDPKLLHVLGWSFFVVGCLTEVEQHDLFRNLMSSSTSNGSASLENILEAMKTCWALRDNGDFGADDFDFSQIGNYLLLDPLIA